MTETNHDESCNCDACRARNILRNKTEFQCIACRSWYSRSQVRPITFGGMVYCPHCN